jgi:hypothetical protein
MDSDISREQQKQEQLGNSQWALIETVVVW